MRRFSLLVLIVAGLSGCGESAPEVKLPPTVPVSGVVKMDGQPLSNATVTFIPQDQKGGPECMGTTDDTGKYTLKQRGGAEGAPVGQHRVLISRMLRGDGSPIPADGAGEGGVATETIPPKYSQSDATTLTATVPEGGGEVNFDLESK